MLASGSGTLLEAILRAGPRAVLIKGGHLEGDRADDLFVDRDGTETWLGAERIETPHTHGTGCTLASACAALWRPDRPLNDTVQMARDYVMGAILMAPGLGHGHGPLRHNWML